MDTTLGKRIVANRKRLGLTQDQLAERLGVTAQAVSKWENDQSCPDITMLPRLAAIFGTSTDALLGITPEPPVHEATVVQDEEQESRDGGWEFRYDNSRQSYFMFAGLALLVGGLYLTSSLLSLNIGLWEIIWPSVMLVLGIRFLTRRFSAVGLGLTVFGGFFLVNLFLPDPIPLDKGVVIALIILLAGGGLLATALRKPKKPKIHFHYNGNASGQVARHEYQISGDDFEFNGSFGDGSQLVELERLNKGEINTSFGDYTVDLSGIAAVSPDAYMEVNASFGNLRILVPRCYHVQCHSNASFADVDFQGTHDQEPKGIIRLDANVSFGHIAIKYI